MAGRVTSVSFWSKFCQKMASSKINSNLKKWLFEIGWTIINAFWLSSVLSTKTTVFKTKYGSRHSGLLWDVCGS